MSMGVIAETHASSPPAGPDCHRLRGNFPAAAGAASAAIIRRGSLLLLSEQARLLSAAATKSFHIVCGPVCFAGEENIFKI